MIRRRCPPTTSPRCSPTSWRSTPSTRRSSRAAPARAPRPRSSSAGPAPHGLEAERLEATPGRPSVLVRARGAGGGRTLLLCGHLDTVGVDGMARAARPRIDGDRLYGRGAYDMKAGVAAALVAARDAAARGLAGDVVVAAVADEEHASLGVQEAVARRQRGRRDRDRADRARAARRAQGLRLERDRGHRPRRARLAPAPRRRRDREDGPGAHRARRARRALAAREHPLLGRGSVHASIIEGGVELSSIPAACTVGVERRTLPGETAADVEAELEALLERCRAADAALEVDAAHAARPRAVRGRPRGGDRDARRAPPRPRSSAPRRRSRAARSGPTPRSSPPPASRRCSSARAARARTPSRSG